MKRLILLMCFVSIHFLSFSQTSFDHISIVVKNLEESKNFYKTVFDFRDVDDPTGNPLIDWLENDQGQQIHMTQGDISGIKTTKSVHYSFSVEALRPFIQNLEQHKITFESWEGEKGGITIRSDGVRQIYLQDTNGYWIEINDRQL